ncbi:hypothetical protein VTL71DRAFT_6552 [Oculimacula yallundae]|uniref:Uncharacterized protein n=1 Tax=Oculimacula yallundae TaxID=86028 RepID=A0ABR4BYF5_9HELO
MEKAYVPILKHRGRIRVLTEDENDNDNNTEPNRVSDKDNERPKMIKNIPETGESTLMMPTQSQGYVNQYQTQTPSEAPAPAQSQSERQIECQHQSQQDKQGQRQSQSYRDNQYHSRSEREVKESKIKIADDYILAGSEYIEDAKLKPGTKTDLTNQESEFAMKDLKEALESEMFRVWPVYEGEETPVSVPGGSKAGKVSNRDNEKGTQDAKSQSKPQGGMEESAIMPVTHATTAEKQRRDAIAEEWKAKEERDITGRKRMVGGYEDVLEDDMLKSLDWFQKPTLKCVRLEEYRRGQDTDEEDSGEEWSRVRRREREERRTGQSWNVKDGIRNYGSGKTDAKTKYESRSASDERKEGTMKPEPQAEGEQMCKWKQESGDKPTLDRRPTQTSSSVSRKDVETTSNSYAKQKHKHQNGDKLAVNRRPRYSRKNNTADLISYVEQEGGIATKSKSQAEQEQEGSGKPTHAQRPTYTPVYKSQKNVTTNSRSQAEREQEEKREGSGKPIPAPGSISSQKHVTTKDAEQDKNIGSELKSQAEQGKKQKNESSDKPTVVRKPTYTSSFAQRDLKARRHSSDSKP